MAKSAVKVKKPKTVPPEISEAKSGKTRASLHNDNTPRSTIQNVLREGTESLFPIWITRSHDLSIHLHLIAFLVFHIYIYIFIFMCNKVAKAVKQCSIHFLLQEVSTKLTVHYKGNKK